MRFVVCTLVYTAKLTRMVIGLKRGAHEKSRRAPAPCDVRCSYRNTRLAD